MFRLDYSRLIAAIGLIVFGISSRIMLSPYPNFETVTLVALLGGIMLGGLYSIIVPLAVICGSDLYIGNNSIAIFTWTGFIALGLAAMLARRRFTPSFNLKTVGGITGLGITGILAYDIWTAFGWWLLFYPHTAGTLTTVFALQIPFTIRHLASGLLTIPIGAAAVMYLSAKVQARLSAGHESKNSLPGFGYRTFLSKFAKFN